MIFMIFIITKNINKMSNILGLDIEIDNKSDDITLKSDDRNFIVSKKVAIQSKLIENIMSNDNNETIISLTNIKGNVLEKVVEFLNYHYTVPVKEICRPLKSDNMNEIVSEWDANYINIDDKLLFDLITAVNYLDIKPLLDLTCAKVASEMKGRSIEEIKERFNIYN